MSVPSNGLDILSFEDIDKASSVSPSADLDVLSFEEVNKPENAFEKFGRHTSRSAARGTEALAGLPGDVLNFLVAGGLKAGKSLGLGDEKSEERASLIQSYLPTSQKIRENITQKATGDYLTPQSKGEEISDEFFGDLATLLLPIKGKIPFARALGMATLGNLGKEGAKAIGMGETGSQATKLGLMTVGALTNRGNARQFANNLYKEAIETIPKDATTGSKQFTAQVDRFITNLQKGGLNPDKQPSYNLAKQLKDKLKKGGGQIAADELPEFRKSINSFRFRDGKRLPAASQYNLDRFDDLINNELLEYGKTNPTFLPKYRDANTAIAGFKQSNKIAKSISKHYDLSKLDPATAVLLGLHLANPSRAAKVGALIGTAKGAALLKRVSSNPILRKHYEDVLKEALKENPAGITRNVALLDKEIRKEED